MTRVGHVRRRTGSFGPASVGGLFITQRTAADEHHDDRYTMSDPAHIVDLPISRDVTAGPDFHRLILDQLPAALIVVDADGKMVYGNEAMVRLGDWEGGHEIERNIFDHIHPDDAGWISEAFVLLATKQLDGSAVKDRPWAPVYFRLVTRTGRVIPVEVIGRDVLDHPGVQGIVYEVRPAYERDIFQRVLAGVATGGDIVDQLDLIMELVSATTLDIEAAVVAHSPDGAIDVVTASRSDLHAVLDCAALDGQLHRFSVPAASPVFTAVDDIDGHVAVELKGLGLVDAWHIDVAVPVLDCDYRIVAFTPIHHIPEMGVTDRLVQAAELAAVVLMRVRSEKLLAHAAHHDPLTDLPNRMGLRQRIDDLRTDGEDLAVLFVDLDGFKAINDSHGHAIGDLVLCEVAERLSGVVRDSDLIARLGGDEFAIVLGKSSTHPHTPRGAIDFAERILDALSTPIAVDGSTHSISASIGFVEVDATTDIETAVAGADQAMYVAKRAGGGRIHGVDSVVSSDVGRSRFR